MSGEITGQSVRTGARRWGRALAAAVLAFGMEVLSGAASAGDGVGPEEYTIAVHVTHEAPPKDGPAAKTSQPADAIVDLVVRRVALLNKAGGIHGRPVRAVFYDDFEDVALTKKNVAAALAEPNLIAMIGLWDSSRGAEVVDEIGRSGVPLISELSVETLFSAYPTIFTLTRSVRHEQQVLQSFTEQQFRKVVFVGAQDDLYTKAYYDYIAASRMGASLVATEWLSRLSGNAEERLAEVVATVKTAEPDLVFLSIGSKKAADFLYRLSLAGVAAPVFLGRGSVVEIQKEPRGFTEYQGSIYELAEGGLANLLNERLEQLKRQPLLRRAARKYESKPLSYGVRYGDLIALVAEGAASGDGAGVAAVRAAVARTLAELQEGRKVWRGWAQDWSFTRERASSERSLLVWRPPGKTTTILAPVQYIETGSGLAPVPVLQAHLDMSRIYRVDTGDKSFEADFFLTLRCEKGVPDANIDFTNAYRGPGGDTRLVNMHEIHREPAGSERPLARIFKVSGKFLFDPDLRKFPFDEQIFSISFQPTSTSSPFLLQPPSDQLLGYKFSVDGWTVQDRYVGSNDLIIRSIAGEMGEERIIPYYNFNFTWVMKRQIVDYIIRVILPLAFMLAIAYLANFIPRTEFNAIIAIQVTALLSLIALRFALNEPAADDATLSDWIFVAAYAVVNTMIALSISEVNTAVVRHARLMKVIQVVQLGLVPIAALAVIAYLIFVAASDFSLLEAVARAWHGALSNMTRHASL